jgi:glucose-6-phosphate-specific signal transduction histidine kinase
MNHTRIINKTSIMPLILASGPQLSGFLLLLLVAAVLCVILPVTFFIYAFVQFWRERLSPGLAALTISILFLLPWLQMGKDAQAFMVISAVVLVLSLPICYLFIIRAKK